LQEIKKYYEVIQRQKLRDLQLHTTATLYAVGAAFGTVKKEKYREFMEMLSMKKKDVHKSLDEMKGKGLPIEDK
jgi:hypothetical protein